MLLSNGLVVAVVVGGGVLFVVGAGTAEFDSKVVVGTCRKENEEVVAAGAGGDVVTENSALIAVLGS